MPDTDAPSATPGSGPGHQQRDSLPGKLRGRIVAVFIAIVVVAFAVVGVRLATQDRLEAEVKTWDVARDGVLPVQVELYRPADRGVTCSVIARDLRQVIVGQVDVDVPASPERHVVVDVEVPLEGDGVAPEIQGCRLGD